MISAKCAVEMSDKARKETEQKVHDATVALFNSEGLNKTIQHQAAEGYKSVRIFDNGIDMKYFAELVKAIGYSIEKIGYYYYLTWE
jgi:hypothetical protein